MISVVCPTFNSSSYIEKTLNSLISQTHPPDEIIFSDDGSTDNTVKIINDWKEPFNKKGVSIKIIKNNHKGAGSARNSAIAKASCDWISFIDSDDIWYSNKIEKVVKIIKTNKKCNAVLHWEYFTKEKNSEKLLNNYGFNYDKNEKISSQLYKNNFLSTSAVTMKKNVILSVGGFDESLPNWQDFDLWLKVSDSLHLYIIEEVLGEYLDNKDSITNRAYYKKVISCLRVFFRHRELVSTPVFTIKIIKTLFSKKWLI